MSPIASDRRFAKSGPNEMRVGQQVLRGYHRDQFEDAFARYVGNGED